VPDLLIINVAPETFVWHDDLRYVIEPNARLWNYIDYKDSLFPLKDGLYRMTRLLSKEQVEASLRVLQVNGTKQSGLPNFITDPNGMIRSTGTKLTSDDLNPDKVFDSIPIYFGTIFAQYQPNIYRLDVLQQILEMAQQHHMLVIGYMPPYHPVMRDVLETRTAFTSNLNFITSQLDNFEKEYPFHYVNFIDSELFSNGDEMFDDIVHPSIEASSLMMQHLYDQFHTYAKPS
jgi:hypothetical protein